MIEDRPPIVDRLREAVQRQQRERQQTKRFSVAELRAVAKIVGLCVLIASAYGVLHDQVTARICIEYFTLGHPVSPGADLPTFLTALFVNTARRFAETESPTLLALFWGVAATWWAGAILGLPLAFICRFGSRPKLGPRDVIKPIVFLLATMAIVAVVAGIIGYEGAKAGRVWLVGPIAAKVPQAKHHLYLADLWAHGAAYTVGFLGGVALWFHAWRVRRRLARTKPEIRLPLPEVSRN